MLSLKIKHTLFVSLLIICLGVFFSWLVEYNSVNAQAARASDRAYDDLRQKDYKAAIKELHEVLRLHPSDRDTQLTLGVTLAKDGQRDTAMATIAQLTQQNDKAGELARTILAKMEKDTNWGKSKEDSHQSNAP